MKIIIGLIILVGLVFWVYLNFSHRKILKKGIGLNEQIPLPIFANEGFRSLHREQIKKILVQVLEEIDILKEKIDDEMQQNKTLFGAKFIINPSTTHPDLEKLYNCRRFYTDLSRSYRVYGF